MRIFHRTKSIYYYLLIKETYLGQQRLRVGYCIRIASAVIVWIKMIPHAISNIHGNKTTTFEQTFFLNKGISSDEMNV